MSAQCARIKKSIHLLQAGLHYSINDQLDQDTAARLVTQPILVHLSPGTVDRQETSLVISHPTFRVTTEDTSSSDMSSSSVTQSPPTSSPVQVATSPSIRSSSTGHSDRSSKMARICPLDIKTVAGATVTVVENGTPAQFYFQFVSEIRSLKSKDMEELLKAVTYEAILPPSPGQGVLVRWGSTWCRATVLGCDGSSWRCELVDCGQVVKVMLVDMTNLPSSVVDIPAMSVSCSQG